MKKAIHVYENSLDNLAVSAICKEVRLGNERLTVHYTLKDGWPMTYWFSLFHHTTKYIDFDVREFWSAIGLPEMKNWTRISDTARLETLASLAESVFAGGHNLLTMAVEQQKAMFGEAAVGF